MSDPNHQGAVREALLAFTDAEPRDAATSLLHALGYVSPKTISLDGKVSTFLSHFDSDGILTQPSSKAQTEKWSSIDFVFQLTNDELPMLAQSSGGSPASLQQGSSYHRSIIQSFVFLTITLEGNEWLRGDLANITREINKVFPMPAIIFFRYDDKLSISLIPRRAHKRYSSRDVIEKSNKVSIIKDIDLIGPHRAHVNIIAELHIRSTFSKKAPSTFDELYTAWTGILSIEELNKRFYNNLSDWYLWASKRVSFPIARSLEDNGKDDQTVDMLNQVSVIRMLTRLIFIWFIKEKQLVPGDFFNSHVLPTLLKDDPTGSDVAEDSTYYHAILQNLFFATLNTKMGADRKWRSEDAKKGRTNDYLVTNVFRHHSAFKDPDKALSLFKRVPFLNGGLFECLDREPSEDEFIRNADLASQVTKEGSQKVIRGDGFSERKSSQPRVPNEIFFGSKIEAPELNKEYGTKGKKYVVDGLLAIFERYKFTVEENTSLDEEVALDPELLGKVFENLIASYNPDTKTSARKLSGSFYTPRVVVDYMVDEALVGYLAPKLKASNKKEPKGLHRHKGINESMNLGPAPDELAIERTSAPKAPPSSDIDQCEYRIRTLLSIDTDPPNLSDSERRSVIDAIEELRAIDPACGSGAFPMGLLNKLVHILQRLDPDNALWKESIRKPLEKQLNDAKAQPDPARKAEALEHAEEEINKLENDFSNQNYADFSRKLYIIDKCIHGVDIQPIAVQIAKLRFFISLVASQKIDVNADNYNVTPLPNLETRLVAANGLIPIVKPDILDLYRNDEIKQLERELKDANERYFGTRTRKSKLKARDTIVKLREKLSEVLSDTQGIDEDEAKKLGKWDPFDQNAFAEFFDPEWMFGLDKKFNIVIANPPYVRQEKIFPSDKKWLKTSHEALKKRKGSKGLFLPEGLYQSFTGTADYLVYFMERGLDLLAPGGSFVFITSNKWFRAAYGKNIRLWMNRASKLRSIIDFGDAEVFDAIAYPTIIVAEKRAQLVTQPAEGDKFIAWAWPEDLSRKDIDDFPSLFRKNAHAVPQKSLDNEKGWQLEREENRDLLSRIRTTGRPLGQYVNGNIFYGIKTGFNEAFVISGEQKDALITKDPKSAEIIKPFLRGKDVKRWHVESEDYWLIFTRRGVDLDRYPAINSHLSRFKERLTPKPENWPADKKWDGRKSGSYKWYEIQDNIAYWEKFETPKIYVPAIQNKVDYAGDIEGFYGNDKTNIIVADDWRFLLGILNSNVSWWLTQQTFSSKQGGYFEFKPMYIETITIPTCSKAQKIIIETLVQLILQNGTSPKIEQLLNGLVYELYFPAQLHAHGVHLFDAVANAEIDSFQGLEDDALEREATNFINTAFAPSHEIYRMLFELRAINEVRLIEGQE